MFQNGSPAALIRQACTGWVRRLINPKARLGVLSLGLVMSATVAETTTPQTRREAAGWLQLERDQTTYRERVGPLDLRDQRQLESIERAERSDLRALQQRQRRDIQTERRRARPDPDAVRAVPRADRSVERRRAVERERLRFRMQREQLPYSRRR